MYTRTYPKPPLHSECNTSVVEYMWLDVTDNTCIGICINGNKCKNVKINDYTCYSHRTQNFAYLNR